MAGMLTEGAMLDKAGSGIGKGLVASGFINPPTPDPVAAFAARNASAGGPVSSAAAKTSQRIAGVVRKNRRVWMFWRMNMCCREFTPQAGEGKRQLFRQKSRVLLFRAPDDRASAGEMVSLRA